MTRRFLSGCCAAVGLIVGATSLCVAAEPKAAEAKAARTIAAPAKAESEVETQTLELDSSDALKKYELERKQAAESLQKVRAKAPFQQSKAIALTSTNEHILGFCVLPDDRLVVISGTPATYGELLPGRTTERSPSNSQVQWLDADGKTLNSVVLDFKPKAVNAASDGSVYVVGEGTIARFDREGKKVAQEQSPHITDVVASPEKFKTYVLERHAEEVASLTEQAKQYEDALKELEEKPADMLSRQELRDIANAKGMAAAYTQMAQKAKAKTDEQVIDQALVQLKELHRVAVSSSHVFVVTSEATGHGYSVWRLTHDLKESKKIVSKLSGCCGQMDIQVAGDGLAIAENSRHRVVVVDSEGKTTVTFGKTSRTDVTKGFGGCCNPMNTCFTSAGALLTSESNGLVKRYTPSGEFQDILGVAKVTEGCKNSSIGISSKGDRLYYFDVEKGHILVLDRST
jgi:hypothetical protein